MLSSAAWLSARLVQSRELVRKGSSSTGWQTKARCQSKTNPAVAFWQLLLSLGILVRRCSRIWSHFRSFCSLSAFSHAAVLAYSRLHSRTPLLYYQPPGSSAVFGRGLFLAAFPLLELLFSNSNCSLLGTMIPCTHTATRDFPIPPYPLFQTWLPATIPACQGLHLEDPAETGTPSYNLDSRLSAVCGRKSSSYSQLANSKFVANLPHSIPSGRLFSF